MGLPGKPDGIDGPEVERYCRQGRIAEVAAYRETDVVNTYRVGCATNYFVEGLLIVAYERAKPI
jgi:predicted PolB exonuclease-like 3'-5' exonuclease